VNGDADHRLINRGHAQQGRHGDQERRARDPALGGQKQSAPVDLRVHGRGASRAAMDRSAASSVVLVIMTSSSARYFR
jgi:hypothetical protein